MLEFVKGLSAFCAVILVCVYNVHGQVCDTKVDLTFIMDSSTSGTSLDDYNNMKDLVKDILDDQNLKLSFATTRANFLQFATTVDFSGNYLTSNRRSQTAVDDLDTLNEAGRDTANALDYYGNNLPTNGRTDAQDVVVLILTGPSDDQQSALAVAQDIHTSDTDVLVVGIGPTVDADEVKALASSPRVQGQNYFLFSDFTGVNSNAEAVAQGICDRDKPAPTTESTPTVPTTTTTSTTTPVPDVSDPATEKDDTDPNVTPMPGNDSAGMVTMDAGNGDAGYTVIVHGETTTLQNNATTEGLPMEEHIMYIVILIPLLLLLLLLILLIILCCHRRSVEVGSDCGDMFCTKCGAGCVTKLCAKCCWIKEPNRKEKGGIRFANIKPSEKGEPTVGTPLNAGEA